MFHSLYQRQQADQATATEPKSKALSLWPATYEPGGFANIDPATWTLEVGGQVARPQTFTVKDLMGFTRIQQNRRLVFADGWTFRAQWEGFVISELLHRVMPEPEARFLQQTSLSGKTECLPVADLISQRALFCLRVDGKTLPPLYGGPLRLMVFDRYAHKGTSQIAKLEFTDREVPGCHSERGQDPAGTIQAGSYYAADLKIIQPVRGPGEITQW